MPELDALPIVVDSLDLDEVGEHRILRVPTELAAKLGAVAPGALLSGLAVTLMTPDGEGSLTLVLSGTVGQRGCRRMPGQIGLSTADLSALVTWNPLEQPLLTLSSVRLEREDSTSGQVGVAFRSIGDHRLALTLGGARRYGHEAVMLAPKVWNLPYATTLLAQATQSVQAAGDVFTQGTRRLVARAPLNPRVPSSRLVLQLRPEAPPPTPRTEEVARTLAHLVKHHGSPPGRTFEPPWGADPRVGPEPCVAKIIAWKLEDRWRLVTLGLTRLSEDAPRELVIEVPSDDVLVDVARDSLVTAASLLTAAPERLAPGQVTELDLPSPLGHASGAALLVPTSLGERFVGVQCLTAPEHALTLEDERTVALLTERLGATIVPDRTCLSEDEPLQAALAEPTGDERRVEGLERVALLPDGGLELHLSTSTPAIARMMEENAPIRLVGPGGEVLLRITPWLSRVRQTGEHRWVAAVPYGPWCEASYLADAPDCLALSAGPVEMVPEEPPEGLPRLKARALRVLQLSRGEPDPLVARDHSSPPWFGDAIAIAGDRFMRDLLEWAGVSERKRFEEVWSRTLLRARAAAVIAVDGWPEDDEEARFLAEVVLDLPSSSLGMDRAPGVSTPSSRASAAPAPVASSRRRSPVLTILAGVLLLAVLGTLAAIAWSGG